MVDDTALFIIACISFTCVAIWSTLFVSLFADGLSRTLFLAARPLCFFVAVEVVDAASFFLCSFSVSVVYHVLRSSRSTSLKHPLIKQSEN